MRGTWQAKLGDMKSPKSVELRAEIPKTAAGKIDRKALRAAYWAKADRAVHGNAADKRAWLLFANLPLSLSGGRHPDAIRVDE